MATFACRVCGKVLEAGSYRLCPACGTNVQAESDAAYSASFRQTRVRFSDLGIDIRQGVHVIAWGALSGQRIMLVPRDVLDLNSQGGNGTLHLREAQPNAWVIDRIT